MGKKALHNYALLLHHSHNCSTIVTVSKVTSEAKTTTSSSEPTFNSPECNEGHERVVCAGIVVFEAISTIPYPPAGGRWNIETIYNFETAPSFKKKAARYIQTAFYK
ncbi:MAG: hypothetical protein A2W93_08105 [Bacteroidetes bacterium GWF2_43_63]|nr:MAG: hypothetical protein A2W94_04760 [Bacteroidetes bacterium GWE2_42_42]OFY55576.1 MAG: hypothetical protein A2W93_08105 [Bacteroidetes bacterium GWF2_43_63]HBG71590.1 hypothetical protein [Bacteroidales bacterium]HCB62123.1 hypothetical protein [Bacteroidales bacterium]HCY22351.1 hypothetical protein [Bacteroidales bacterium]